MYELNCPVLDRNLRLDQDHILSAHWVSSGLVAYLRCACGSTAMWSTAGPTFHPGTAPAPAGAA